MRWFHPCRGRDRGIPWLPLAQHTPVTYPVGLQRQVCAVSQYDVNGSQGGAIVWQPFVLDLFLRIAHDLEQALEGLTVEELHYQPSPASNSIAWLAWHLTRSHDRNISELT